MRKAYAVIGAGYGDEGKGAMVDFLASRLIQDGYSPIVARCNGGGQAGHTVVTPDGKRHVFKHHGSGSLLDCSTYLSDHFIVNPAVFKREQEELAKLEVHLPTVFVSPDAIVTIPMDMMINQALELSRGDKRHGSCGVGINETVERNTHYAYRTQVKHLDRLTLDVIRAIRKSYGFGRLNELNLQTPKHFKSEEIDEAFLQDVEYFLGRVTLLEPSALKQFSDAIIFEGAQGLGLHQSRAYFPYVTRSNTGQENIVQTLTRIDAKARLQTIYVSRCYATRHGAGPLEWEGYEHGANVADETNFHNPWQHSFRTAPLDLDVLYNRINQDIKVGDLALAITCLDQVNEKVTVCEDGNLIDVTPTELIQKLKDKFYTKRIYIGKGPTRNDISGYAIEFT